MDNLRMKIRTVGSRYSPKAQIRVTVTLMVPKGSTATLRFVNQDRFSRITTLLLQVSTPDDGRLKLNAEEVELVWDSTFHGFMTEACQYVKVLDDNGKTILMDEAEWRAAWED